jgi:hypothetical protein
MKSKVWKDRREREGGGRREEGGGWREEEGGRRREGDQIAC